MKKYENFSKWFDEMLLNAEILDNRYPIKGFAVYRGWGAKIVRSIAEILENKLEETGHIPMLFPVTIAEESFKQEARHIKGFTSEVFWITHAGNRKLKRRMLLRPTSETAMYPMFAQWIRSHADLPLKIFQSGCVYRYETKATRPLFRMREFLWNEGHTAHKNWEEAEEQVREAIKIYDEVFKSLGLSYYILKRPDFDKFAGAVYSIAFDAWNPDGRVNQIGTVHNLGENFSRAFDITYEDIEGEQRYVVQTCYGFGISRTLAAIISQHGDDHGLVLPPSVAPIQVVIIPIPYKGVEAEIEEYARRIFSMIEKAELRVYLDETDRTPGEKYYYWEMFGVPVRVEVGPRDLKEKQVTICERVNLERTTVALEEAVNAVKEIFKKIAVKLKERSILNLSRMTANVEDMEALRKAIKARKIARVCWCGSVECAEKIKEESEGEIRGYRIDIEEKPEHNCIACGGDAEKVVYVARAY